MNSTLGGILVKVRAKCECCTDVLHNSKANRLAVINFKKNHENYLSHFQTIYMAIFILI